MRFAFAFAVVFLLSGAGGFLGGDSPPAVQTLVDAELDFAGEALRSGVRAAFLSFLADDGLIFRPEPVLGKLHYRNQVESQEVLTWNPVYAEVSASGDLGFTTGPWELSRTGADGGPASFGHYLSLWRIQPQGGWKVVLDAGIEHERPPQPSPPLEYRLGDSDLPPKKWERIDIGEERSALRLMDDLLTGRCAEAGISVAYGELASAELRLYRAGSQPVLGLDAAREALPGAGGAAAWNPEGVEVSRSADLGYTFGTAVLREGEASYVHVWRKEADSWKLAVDILIPR